MNRVGLFSDFEYYTAINLHFKVDEKLSSPRTMLTSPTAFRLAEDVPYEGERKKRVRTLGQIFDQIFDFTLTSRAPGGPYCILSEILLSKFYWLLQH